MKTKKPEILYIQSPDESLGIWYINYRCIPGHSYSHNLQGYGREGLLKYIPAGTEILITAKINIRFILDNENIDFSGYSQYSNNLTNEQYIAGMIENGAYTIKL